MRHYLLCLSAALVVAAPLAAFAEIPHRGDPHRGDWYHQPRWNGRHLVVAPVEAPVAVAAPAAYYPAPAMVEPAPALSINIGR